MLCAGKKKRGLEKEWPYPRKDKLHIVPKEERKRIYQRGGGIDHRCQGGGKGSKRVGKVNQRGREITVRRLGICKEEKIASRKRNLPEKEVPKLREKPPTKKKKKNRSKKNG